jgi:hypothetical protein
MGASSSNSSSSLPIIHRQSISTPTFDQRVQQVWQEFMTEYNGVQGAFTKAKVKTAQVAEEIWNHMCRHPNFCYAQAYHHSAKGKDAEARVLINMKMRMLSMIQIWGELGDAKEVNPKATSHPMLCLPASVFQEFQEAPEPDVLKDRLQGFQSFENVVFISHKWGKNNDWNDGGCFWKFLREHTSLLSVDDININKTGVWIDAYCFPSFNSDFKLMKQWILRIPQFIRNSNVVVAYAGNPDEYLKSGWCLMEFWTANQPMMFTSKGMTFLQMEEGLKHNFYEERDRDLVIKLAASRMILAGYTEKQALNVMRTNGVMWSVKDLEDHGLLLGHDVPVALHAAMEGRSIVFKEME